MSVRSSDYSTLEPDLGGFDYRTIALQLTADGNACGHSTVRNIVLRVMEKLAYAIMGQYGIRGSPSEVARNPGFQRSMALLVQEAYVSGHGKEGEG